MCLYEWMFCYLEQHHMPLSVVKKARINAIAQ